jgi:broad specificity phosphatase PhoE
LIRLVRHGRAAAGWDVDPDPDLDDLGRTQARAVAEVLAASSLAGIVTSPLLRCRSTARPLAERTGVDVRVQPEVAEIPSPEGVDMAARVDWLRTAVLGPWAALGPRYTTYRDRVVEFVRSCDDATVVFSHFVAINAVIGACLGDDRVVIRSLDNCSITTVAVGDGRLRLVEGGHEADTLIR